MLDLQKNILTGIEVSNGRNSYVLSVLTVGELLSITRYSNKSITELEAISNPSHYGIYSVTDEVDANGIANYLISTPELLLPTNFIFHIPKAIIDSISKSDVWNINLSQKLFDELSVEGGNVYISVIDGLYRLKGIELAIERLKVLVSESDKYKDRLEELLNLKLTVTFFLDKSVEEQLAIRDSLNFEFENEFI